MIYICFIDLCIGLAISSSSSSLAQSALSSPNWPTVDPHVTELVVSWTAPAGTPTDYDVRNCDVSSGDCDTWSNWSFTGAGTTTTITGLTTCAKYEVQLRDSNGGATSGWSGSGSGIPGAPQTPAAPTLTEGPGEIMVSWTAPADNGSALTGYEVRFWKLPVVRAISGTIGPLAVRV